MQRFQSEPAVRAGTATHDDLATVATIFRDAFPNHPAARLSFPLLQAFLDAHRRCTFIVLRDDEARVCGFAVGGRMDQLDACRAAFIRSHLWQLGLSALWDHALLRPLRARLRFARPRVHPPASPYQMRFIAIHERARGTGAGSELLAQFETTLPAGCAYHAWTLAGPSGAVSFYHRNGFAVDVVIDGHTRMQKHR